MPPQAGRLGVVVRRRPVLAAIIAVWLPLAALSLAGQLYLYVFGGTHTRIPRRLNVDSELTVWAWFQSTLLFACAALLAVAAFVAYRRRDRYVRHWLVLSLALLWVSVDEAAAIHEMTITPLHNALDTHGIFYFAWVIPALLLVVVLGVGKNTLHLCGGHVVIGALGGDLVGGHWYEAHGDDNLTYALMTQIEENLETAGISLGIVAVLTYFIRVMPEWVIRLEA